MAWQSGALEPFQKSIHSSDPVEVYSSDSKSFAGSRG
jgi:hypothetical protein